MTEETSSAEKHVEDGPAESEAQTLENVDLNDAKDNLAETQSEDTTTTAESSSQQSQQPVDEPSTPSEAIPATPAVVVSEHAVEDDSDSKNLSSVPETPTDGPSQSSLSLATPKPRRSKRSSSFVLSQSSVNSGQHTVSSAVFIKKALETISKHKTTAKNAPLDSATTKALSMSNPRCFFW